MSTFNFSANGIDFGNYSGDDMLAAMEAGQMTPDSSKHNPDPAYLRGLIARADISQQEAARRLGISPRLMRMYLADRATKTAQECPYSVQFGLEALARSGKKPAKCLGVGSST